MLPTVPDGSIVNFVRKLTGKTAKNKNAPKGSPREGGGFLGKFPSFFRVFYLQKQAPGFDALGRSGRPLRVVHLRRTAGRGGRAVDVVVGTCFVARHQRFDDELDSELVDTLDVLRVAIPERSRDGRQERFLDALRIRAKGKENKKDKPNELEPSNL